MTLLEILICAVIVAVSLGGFAVALGWTFAIWFGRRR